MYRVPSLTRGLQKISNESIGKIGAPITHMTFSRLSWSYLAQCICLFCFSSCFSIAKVKSEKSLVAISSL